MRHCCNAPPERRAHLVWLGIWSAMWGGRPLTDSLAAVGLLPHWFKASVPYLDVVISYMILVVALLAFLDLTLGKLRILPQTVILVGLAMALAGIGFFVCARSNTKPQPYNNLLATCSLAVLVTVVTIPKLSRKFLVLPNRGVLAVGTLVFALRGLYANLTRPLGYRISFIWDSPGFAALLFSLGYVAIQIISSSECRLLSIEKELEIAREIQSSILPNTVPELKRFRMHAAFRPMTAVAGDFYEFIPIDQNRIGVLMADVTGHGVPAALIASKIKMAMQSVVPCAHDPREVLHGLDRLLSGQLHGQFVSAAYLWLDTENRTAPYSAAGHPPLLRCREGKWKES